MRTTYSIFLLICLIIILAAGCSKGENPINTISPSNPGSMIENNISGVSDYFSNGDPAAGMGTLGLFDLAIDPISVSAQLTPLRKSSLVDVLEVVDITNFMTISPCVDCIKLGGISSDLEGNLILSIGVKHPFDAGDIERPISGINRGDLHVFNVEGIVVSDSYGVSYPGLNETVNETYLKNCDGITGYLDSSLDTIFPSDSTAHPYILHFDDYSSGNFAASNPMGFESVTTPPPSGNLVMAMGSDYDYQDYVFKLDSGEQLRFIFAIGCTYAVSALSKSDRFAPEYRVPQHNKKAPSEIWVEVINNNLQSGNTSSTADLNVNVVDISQSASVGTNLDEMFALSQVSEITIEIPGVMTSLLNVNISFPTGSGNDPTDPLVFSTTATNTAGGISGTYTALVKVVDSYPTGQNSFPGILGMDGIERVDPGVSPLNGLFTINEFATFQTFEITIAGVQPTATVTDIDPNWGTVDTTVADVIITGTDFDPSATVELEYSISDIITGENVTWLNSTSIEVDFNLSGATLGTYDVKVTNPSTSPGILVDGFEVMPPSACPYAPNAAYAYTETPETYSGTDYIAYIHDNTIDDCSIDVDMLHNTSDILIYNIRDSINEIRGMVPSPYPDYPAPGSWTTYVTDVEVMSIDVTMSNRIIYVDFDDSVLTGLTGEDLWFPRRTKVAEGADTVFHVFDTGTMTEIGTGFDIGAQIQAIDVDANDDIWILDINNEMHLYEESGGTYVENTGRSFDMDTNGSNMQGLAYDFVINFHNEAFYILTNHTIYGYLYRVECDGVFNSLIDGNPNPVVDISDRDGNDRADIVIDNFDDAGVIHDGEQDAQIACLATIYLPPPYFPTTDKIGITRIDAALGNDIWYEFAGSQYTGYGVFAATINGITNKFWIKGGPTLGNEHIMREVFVPSGEWY